MSSDSRKRKLSIWRPFQAAKIILSNESNVIKASPKNYDHIAEDILERAKGSKDKFAGKNIATQGFLSKNKKKVFYLILFVLFSVPVIYNYDLIYLKILYFKDYLPTGYQVGQFFSAFSLDNFMKVLGEAGLKITNMDR